MGVFDFVKEAGAKVGIGSSEADEAAAAASEKAASADRAKEVAAKVLKRRDDRAAKAAQDEREERFEEAKQAAGLEKYVRGLGLDAKINISVDDDVATITGTAPNQATRERIILAVGNVQTISQVRDSIKVDASTAESQMHVVESGDTLSKLAKSYYGDATKYPTIFEANKPMLKDPDKIFVGQVLRIPADA